MSKKTHHVNIKYLKFFGGVALALLSIVLILNIGFLSRAIAFPTIYLFGLGHYVFYAWIYTIGMMLIFKNKVYRPKKVLSVIGIILIALSLSTFISLIYASVDNVILTLGKTVDNKVNFIEHLNIIIGQIGHDKGYFAAEFINLFTEYKVAGGLFGNLFAAILSDVMAYALAVTIAIVVFVLGLALIVLPKLTKHKKLNKKKDQIKVEQAITNINVENENEEIPENFLTAPSLVKKTDLSHRIISSDTNDTDNIILKPAVFKLSRKRGDEFAENPYKFNTENNILSNEKTDTIVNTVVRENISDINTNDEINENFDELIDNDIPESDRHEEQIQLDYDSRPTFNEELVQAKPEFDTPSPIERKEENIVIEPEVYERVKWIAPSLELLDTYDTSSNNQMNIDVAEERLALLNDVFIDLNIGATCVSYTIGPSVTRFEIEYDKTSKVKAVASIVSDISVRLGGVSVIFNEAVPGTKHSGIEIANKKISTVGFKDIMEKLDDPKKHPSQVAFGKNISGEVIKADFNEFPHILVSGTTGSGKSIYLNSLICTLIMRNSPDDLKIVLVDPKKVEMSKYRDMPHLLCPIITDASQTNVMLKKMHDVMEERYEKFSNEYGCVNIEEYNDMAAEDNKPTLPSYYIFLDEYADLVDTCKEIAGRVVSLAQKARAAGIHILIATQRPSTNVISGVIKGNLPTKVALLTASSVDSTVIIGVGGAEKLLGKGDMLVSTPLISTSGPVRVQGCYIATKEMIRVVNYLKEHYKVNYDKRFLKLEPEEDPSMSGSNAFLGGGDGDDDELKYRHVKEWVISEKYMSVSKIQANCSVGFNRARRIFNRLQEEGIVAKLADSPSLGCRVLENDISYDSDIPTSSEIIDDGDNY